MYRYDRWKVGSLFETHCMTYREDFTPKPGEIYRIFQKQLSFRHRWLIETDGVGLGRSCLGILGIWTTDKLLPVTFFSLRNIPMLGILLFLSICTRVGPLPHLRKETSRSLKPFSPGRHPSRRCRSSTDLRNTPSTLQREAKVIYQILYIVYDTKEQNIKSKIFKFTLHFTSLSLPFSRPRVFR